jgi:GNAT superfamily N-acetyltransferase
MGRRERNSVELLGQVRHTAGMIRLGTPADLTAVSRVFRDASLSNEGDRENLLARPAYLVLGPEGLAEGRTYIAELDGQLTGFATWAETAGGVVLEDLFVDPAFMRRGIATALLGHVANVLGKRGIRRLEVIASPYALDFYRAAGFTGCGPAMTEFGTALRMELTIR